VGGGNRQLQHWLMTHTIPPIDPNGMCMFFQQKLTTHATVQQREGCTAVGMTMEHIAGNRRSLFRKVSLTCDQVKSQS